MPKRTPEQKVAYNAYMRQWRANNRERRNASSKRYYEKNKAAIKERYEANYKHRHRDLILRRSYGITASEYEAMLSRQNGTCAICKQVCVTGKSLAVDHCHESGLVRGLLCTKCNQGIGQLNESPALLRNAAEYLEQYNINLNKGINPSGLLTSLNTSI